MARKDEETTLGTIVSFALEHTPGVKVIALRTGNCARPFAHLREGKLIIDKETTLQDVFGRWLLEADGLQKREIELNTVVTKT